MILDWTQFDENITTPDTFNRDSTVFDTKDRAEFTDAFNSYTEFALCRHSVQQGNYVPLQNLLLQFGNVIQQKSQTKFTHYLD
jgi:hypothetical protein